MIREPKIPMSPEDLPQQRIHEVVTLPKRPAEFDCKVGYELSPHGELPKNAPTKSTYLCQVEWACVFYDGNRMLGDWIRFR